MGASYPLPQVWVVWVPEGHTDGNGDREGPIMNNPEYCQAIYEAAKKVVETYNNGEKVRPDEMDMWVAIGNLELALEGKESKP